MWRAEHKKGKDVGARIQAYAERPRGCHRSSTVGPALARGVAAHSAELCSGGPTCPGPNSVAPALRSCCDQDLALVKGSFTEERGQRP